MTIIQKPSPNYSKGKKSNEIVVVHATGSDSDKGALSWLTNPKSKVSSHYLVFRDGTTYQLVDEADTAWHAGVSKWGNKTNLNAYSIGVELVCSPTSLYTNQELESLIKLCRDIVARHKIREWNVVRHSDIAPKRKSDPYKTFPWKQFINTLFPPSNNPPNLVIPPFEAMDENDPNYIFPWASKSVEKIRKRGVELKQPNKPYTGNQIAVILDKLNLI